jgi:ATP-dependent DNA helicase RecQ
VAGHLEQLDGVQREKFDRLTSQAFLAVSQLSRPVDDDVRFFCAVARKIIQRGRNPVWRWLEDMELIDCDPDEWMHAAIGPTGTATELDPSIELNPAYEEPFWRLLQGEFPELNRVLIPQPSLDAMINQVAEGGSRWADFALVAPWLENPVVFEIDGLQHKVAAAVDRHRDASLAQFGFRVRRIPGPEVLSDADLRSALAWTVQRRPPAPSRELLEVVHGPAAMTRTAIALVELIANGALEPGGVWSIDLQDAESLVGDALLSVIELLRALDNVWSLGIAPSEVRSSAGTWVRGAAGYVEASPTDSIASIASIVLEPFVPPHAPLPAAVSPTVVIRGAYRPGNFRWLTQEAVPRRDVDADPDALRSGLQVIVRELFGFKDFREGQFEAIESALRGLDACILLPTGAGKSLIYQLAGLLKPGVTLVVDPLVSLIDDQERRLREDGVDRVTGLHSGRLSKPEERDATYSAIADGDNLVVFLTPERLQIGAFREALLRAAEAHQVNLAVVDEAHCVSEWGHDFRTAYLRVGRNARKLCTDPDGNVPPLLALTGTASPGVLRDVLRELEQPKGPSMQLVRPDSFDRPNLSYQVIEGDEASWQSRLHAALVAEVPTHLKCDPVDLVRLVGAGTKAGIVFVPHTNGPFGIEKTRARVREAFASIDRGALNAEVEIYAGQEPRGWPGGRAAWNKRKAEAAARYQQNRSAILVATKAFGMGIDKPNIRWTIHVGYPGSLEAFAQEAGRAGRDGQPAHCVLVASPPEPAVAELLLDPESPRHVRVGAYEQLGQEQDSDLTRQYFFLTNNFHGIEEEVTHALDLLASLLPVGAHNTVVIPWHGGFGSDATSRQEKALYRLAMVGVVDDYIVDYGAQAFTIHLAEMSQESVDAAILSFVARVQPGRSAAWQRAVDEASPDLGKRISHHLLVLLEVLYEVIEPARVRALAEMHNFATSGDDDEGLRTRILTYLDDGPLAGVLNELATAMRIDVPRATAWLDEFPAEDPREWVGAAARQLEAYPDHPVLLLVRGLGEAMLAVPDLGLVETNLASAFHSLGEYEVSLEDALTLFAWAAAQLRNQMSGRGWVRIPCLYAAWTASDYPDAALEDYENRVLKQVSERHFLPLELRVIAARRLQRMAVATNLYTTRRTSRSAS